MKNIVFLIMVMTMVSGCATTSSDERARQKAEAQQQLKDLLPKHWRQETISEPVFNSQIFTVEVGDRNKPTVLLVHGLGQTGMNDWKNTIPALEKDYFVVALDLPGFGLSDQPQGFYSPANYSKVINALVKHKNLDRFHLVGYSMGGAVALYYAQEYATPVESLTLIGAAGIIDRSAFIKALSNAQVNTEKLPDFLKKNAKRFMSWTDSVVERLNLGPDYVAKLKRNPDTWNKVVGKAPNINAALSLVDTNFGKVDYSAVSPTHIIWGVKDNVAPLRTAYVLKDRLQGSRLTLIDGASHAPMTSHTEQFNQILLAGLKNDNHPKSPPISSKPTSESLFIENEYAKAYSGNYEHITIKNSTAILLHDLSAKKMTIEGSTVTLLKVQVETDGVALYLSDSVVNATSLNARADQVFEASKSRLDIAGGELVNNQQTMMLPEDSIIIFSLVSVINNGIKRLLHGGYNSRLKLTLDDL